MAQMHLKLLLPIGLSLLLLGCGGGGENAEIAGRPPQTAVAAVAVLPQPVGVKLMQATQTSVSIQWEDVPEVTDYRVTRNSTQVILAEDTQDRFRDADLTPGQTYDYVIDALAGDGTVLRRMTISAMTKMGAAELTEDDQPPADIVRARSLTTMGWTPNPLYDTCPKWLHDAHWTFGPDNKAYPTWHPPVYEYANGSLCRFGHEHGQDQRQSRLYGTVGPVPFGYVNEQLSPEDPSFQRNEDHFGHKVAMFNGLKMLSNGQPGAGECDVLFKLHQGTHSPDALKNNTHERFLNYSCSNGLEVRYKTLQPFGKPNTFTLSADNLFSRIINTTGASPANQPSGSDRRLIPGLESMLAYVRAYGGVTENTAPCDNCDGTPETAAELRAIGYPGSHYVSLYNRETWQGGPAYLIAPPSGNAFRFFGGPYWNLASSSRYYAPTSPTLIERQIDFCYDAGSALYNSADCKLARYRGRGSPVPWDSPLSPFNGAVRFNEANNLDLYNPSKLTERVYFTPFGQTNLPYNELPLKRTTTYRIRGYFKATGATPITIQLSNWAGAMQCGGSACYTNFNYYRLRDGTLITAGVHAPN